MKYHEYINPAAIHRLCQKAIPSPLAPGLGANLAGARGLPMSPEVKGALALQVADFITSLGLTRCLSDKQIEVMNQLRMNTDYIYRYL